MAAGPRIITLQSEDRNLRILEAELQILAARQNVSALEQTVKKLQATCPHYVNARAMGTSPAAQRRGVDFRKICSEPETAKKFIKQGPKFMLFTKVTSKEAFRAEAGITREEAKRVLKHAESITSYETDFQQVARLVTNLIAGCIGDRKDTLKAYGSASDAVRRARESDDEATFSAKLEIYTETLASMLPPVSAPAL